MKTCFALLMLLAVVVASAFYYFEAVGNPFYVNLTRYSVNRFLESRYKGQLKLESAEFENGEYVAYVTDHGKSVYRCTYYPDENSVGDGYYGDTVLVAENLFRNTVRSVLSVNAGRSIPIDRISVSLDMPRYVYSVGSSGSPYDCSAEVVIVLTGEYGNKESFASEAHRIISVISAANIGVEKLTVRAADYGITVYSDGFPGDAESTAVLTEIITLNR